LKSKLHHHNTSHATDQTPSLLGKSLVKVAHEVLQFERHISMSEVRRSQRILLHSRHSILIASPVRPAYDIRKLQLVVSREASEILNLDVVALAIGTLVRAVVRCSAAEDAQFVVVGVVDPDDNVLPVVAG
jgi:hypothetical protein